MKRIVFLTISLAMVLLAFTWLFTGDMRPRMKATESSQIQPLSDTSQEETIAKSIAGYWAYKDPVTGKFGPPPPGTHHLEFSGELQKALSTSSEGLMAIESPVPGGGIMVRLNGRFMNLMVATEDTDGKANVQCLSTGPASAESNTTEYLTTAKENEKE